MNPPPAYAELLGQLASSWQGLPDKPEETPEGTLRALWFAAAGEPRSIELAATGALPELSAGEARLRELVTQRLAGAPLAHLTGRQRFLDLEFLAGPDALIPRKETEILGRAALELLRERVAVAGSARVLDVCTGSGNLALALAHHVPAATVAAADLSPEAVALARRNAAHLGLAARVEFRVGDLLAPFDEPACHGQIDLLTCNPPYISTAKVAAMPAEIARHEPRLAFDGGGFGFSILSRVIKDAPRFLKPGGWLCFEVGRGQGPYLVGSLKKSKEYTEVRPLTDAHGEVRALAARTIGPA